MKVPESDYGVGVTVFVASTMPFAIVRNMAMTNTEMKLVLMAKNLYPAYSYINETFQNISISVLPQYFLKHAIYLAFILTKAALLKRKIVFFHECCCPILDVLIKLIRPNGHYYPIVEMSNAARLSSFKYYPFCKIKYFLQITFLWRWFIVYEAPPVDKSLKNDYFLALKKYPKSIKIHSVKESRSLSVVNLSSLKIQSVKKIIFLCGVSLFDTSKVILILESIAEYALQNGFECYVKDHPNTEFRLGFNYPGLTLLDPKKAVESMDDVYSLAIGITSNSLSLFGERSVSVVNMVDGLSEQDRALAIKFIKNLPGAESIKYPDSMDQMFCILDIAAMNYCDDSLRN